MYAQDSIDLLQNSGIQFKKHEEDGIDPSEFAEMLMTSGIVLMDNIKWLSFHSGYDFGYLLKLLTDQNLPAEEGDFFELLRMYFPNIYDVKYLMKSCKNLKGGLQEVADQLELRRVGPQHQAGSDSHLTGLAFFKMREVYDSVEFRLALKKSEERLFWRCMDEASLVTSSDSDSNAAAGAKNIRNIGTIGTGTSERTTTAAITASVAIDSNGADCAADAKDVAGAGPADDTSAVAVTVTVAATAIVSDQNASSAQTAVEADENTTINTSTSGASTEDTSAIGTSITGSLSAANSTTSDSVDTSTEPTETDINQNIISKENPSDE